MVVKEALEKLAVTIKGLFTPFKTKSRGQLLLSDNQDGDWTLTLTNPFNQPKLVLSFPTREKARAARTAIRESYQLYELRIDRGEYNDPTA